MKRPIEYIILSVPHILFLFLVFVVAPRTVALARTQHARSPGYP